MAILFEGALLPLALSGAASRHADQGQDAETGLFSPSEAVAAV